MPEEQKNAIIKSLEKGIKELVGRINSLEGTIANTSDRNGDLVGLVVRMCHEKGCDNLPGLYGFKPYSVTANDMTKYKKERP